MIFALLVFSIPPHLCTHIVDIIFFQKKVGKNGGLWGILCNFEADLRNRSTDMRLLGNIEAKTDSKGRVFLPAGFRKVLQGEGDSLVLRKDVYQPCLSLYPESSWNDLMDTFRSRLNRWNPRHQQLYRQFLSDVEMVSPDSSGRILIPKRLLESAGITQGIRFIGMGDYIEIWSSDQMERSFIDPSAFADALEQLMGSHAVESSDNSDRS